MLISILKIVSYIVTSTSDQDTAEVIETKQILPY